MIPSTAPLKKFSIAFFIDDFRRGGGTENQFHILLKNIDRSRFDPHIFSLRPDSTETDTGFDCPTHYLGVKRLFSWHAFRVILTTARYLRKHRVDLVHVFFFDSRFLGTIAGKLARVDRIIFSRREMGWWHTKTKILVARFLASISDYCLVNAQAVKKMVGESEHFPCERIEVIHNGVALQSTDGSRPITRSNLNLPETVQLVGIVANFRHVKRHDWFLSAASLVQDHNVHFLLVGQGPLKSELMQRATEMGLEERVHFMHTIDALPSVLNLIDIGVLTSESEGLSNVLVEYGLAGKPTVAFRVGGNPEVVIDGKTGYLADIGDVDSMAQFLDTLLKDRDLQEKLGGAARSHTRAKFSIDSMVRQTERFYENILS